jgi:hypothetical protein
MSHTWGNEKLKGTKRNLVLIRKILRPLDAIVPRSEAQYWVLIFVMLIVGILLLATLFDRSPIFR